MRASTLRLCLLLLPCACSDGDPLASRDVDPAAVDAGADATTALDFDAQPGAGGRALTVHADNPRYFDDGSGRAIVLVGVNNGWELQDFGWEDGNSLDWATFLDYLEGHRLNFVRLWRVESPQQTADDEALATPMPYVRTGPGNANDGAPRFDLDRFDAAYFERLRQRCTSAGERGIYVDIMLFERHSTFHSKGRAWPWAGHPFHAANNVNGIDADGNGDGQGREYFLLPDEGGDADVLARQEDYVREVIDTVADLDNVLFEICNECPPEANAWQQHLLDVAREHMATKPLQHPLGFTGPGRYDDGEFPDFDVQLASPADFVSPRNNTTYRNNPPANDGTKVIFADSDHIDPFGRDEVWVWKSFTRGLHPQALEPLEPAMSDAPARDERVRQALGDCRDYAERMNLAGMTPRNGLCSSRYCLVEPGAEYLVFVPGGGAVEVDVSAVSGAVSVEWLRVRTGDRHVAGSVAGGALASFEPPFEGHAVLYLLAE